MHKVFTSFEKQAKQEPNCIALVNLSSFESQSHRFQKRVRAMWSADEFSG
jgi:hypothetical protein